MPRKRAPPEQSTEESSADEATAISLKLTQDYKSTGTTARPPGPAPRKTQAQTAPEAVVTLGWFSRLRSVELENEGSTARDHLALERTFLAWLRTSLAFASIGVGISQLFRLNAAIRPSDPPQGYATLRHMGKPLGIAFLATAVVVLLVGGHRYFESQGWLLKGKFPASRGSIYLLTGIVALLTTTVLVIVLIVQPSHVEG